MSHESKNLVVRIALELDSVLNHSALNWNQEKYAAMDARTWRRWERGETENPKPEKASILADGFWKFMNRPENNVIRSLAFEKLRELVPKAQDQPWIMATTRADELALNRIRFMEWLANLAKKAANEDKTSPGPVLPDEPLEACLELLVRDVIGNFHSIKDKPELLPVKTGDQLRVRVTLNQPAWLCLVWVDQYGNSLAMHRWPDAAPDDKSSFEFLGPAKEIFIPARLTSQGESSLTVNGPPGLETLALLVSRVAPVQEMLAGVCKILKPAIPKVELMVMRNAVPNEYPRGFHPSSPAPSHPAGTRGPGFLRHDDPVRTLHDGLADKLSEHCDRLLLMSFPNAGEPAKSRLKKNPT